MPYLFGCNFRACLLQPIIPDRNGFFYPRKQFSEFGLKIAGDVRVLRQGREESAELGNQLFRRITGLEPCPNFRDERFRGANRLSQFF